MKKEEFLDFIKDENRIFLQAKQGDWLYTITKCPSNPSETDISRRLISIYSVMAYKGGSSEGKLPLSPKLREKPEYAGTYSFATDDLYDISYNMERLLDCGFSSRSVNTYEQVITRLADALSVRIDQKLADLTRDELIGNLCNPSDRQDYESWDESRATDSAFDLFCYGKSSDTLAFEPYINEDELSDQDFVGMLSGSQEFLERRSNAYLCQHLSSLSKARLVFLAKRDALAKLEFDDCGIHNSIRSIINGIEPDMKTVNVTIIKSGIEFSFKIDADALRSMQMPYSTYRIAANDRKRFEETFGRHEDFRAQDILQITFGKRVLYES